MITMPGKPWSEPVPPLSDQERLIQDRLVHHVKTLAGSIGERNVWHPKELEAARSFIHKTFEDLGYTVRTQSLESHGQMVQNLEIEIGGNKSPNEIIIVGAHYDSITGTPGANDNASGVAALLELARLMAGNTYPRTIRLVAFVNEEPPFFYSDEMGSKQYADRSKRQGEQIVAMLALETIGYYTNTPGSQQYPFPFSFFYPNTGNFIGFVGNLSSQRLVRQAIAEFRSTTAFPSEGLAAPGWMMGVHWSDHWSFWQNDYQAIMITDTALFRYQHYHAVTDTPDKLDYESLARVTRGLFDVINGLAMGVNSKM